MKAPCVLLWAAPLIALLCAGMVTQAAVVTIGPQKDNTLYQTTNGSLSDGIGPHVYVGQTGSGQLRRGLIAFNIASAVPAGATITNATLTMNLSRVSFGKLTLSLYAVSQNWGEGTSNSGDPGGGGAPATTNDATWLHTFYNTALWTNPGGDYVSTASYSVPFTNVNGSYALSRSQMTADVQSWVQNPSTNFGWIMIGNETALNTAMRFDSKDTISGTVAPSLAITYSTAPEPSLIVGLIACGALLRRRSPGRHLWRDPFLT